MKRMEQKSLVSLALCPMKGIVWIRLQGDPWDMKVKGTNDEEGHVWQAGDTEGILGSIWNTPQTMILWLVSVNLLGLSLKIACVV